MKILAKKLSTLAIFSFAFSGIAFAENPIVQTAYTPDPAAMVLGDTVYMYTGDDAPKSTWFTLKKWRTYSTKDMVNWTDHGCPLKIEDFKWAFADAWASQCIERDGKFYWYVCINQREPKGMTIAVATSNSPTGPFTDPLGKPLASGAWGYIDPSAFVDDDGQAYLYWGNPGCFYAKLNKDMISFDGNIVEIEQTEENFGGPIKPEKGVKYKDLYEEGPFIYKKNGKYYLLYAAGGVPEHLSYSMSDSPTGPWKYMGKIMYEEDIKSFTNHPAAFEFKGKNYFVYHTGTLPGGGGFNRSTCIEEFEYNKDGTIPRIRMTKEGVKPVGTLNPYKRVEAETIAWSEGLNTAEDAKTGVFVNNINGGDYIKVRVVNFGKTSPRFFAGLARCAGEGGEIEIRKDSLEGEVLGTLKISKTKDWKMFTTKLTGKVTGVHDIFFVFKGAGDEPLFDFDAWTFFNTPSKNSLK